MYFQCKNYIAETASWCFKLLPFAIIGKEKNRLRYSKSNAWEETMTCVIYKTSVISLFSFSSTVRSKNSVYCLKLCDLLSVHQSRTVTLFETGPRRTVNARKVRAGLCHTTHTLVVGLNDAFRSRYFAREPRHFVLWKIQCCRILCWAYATEYWLRV